MRYQIPLRSYHRRDLFASNGQHRVDKTGQRYLLDLLRKPSERLRSKREGSVCLVFGDTIDQRAAICR